MTQPLPATYDRLLTAFRRACPSSIRLNLLEAGFRVLQRTILALQSAFPHPETSRKITNNTNNFNKLPWHVWLSVRGGEAPISRKAVHRGTLLRLDDFGDLCRRARLANVTGITARDQFLCQYLWLDVVRAMASMARMNIDRSLEACWPWHGPRF